MSHSDLFCASRAIAGRKSLQLQRLERFAVARWHWWYRWPRAQPSWMVRRLRPLVERTILAFQIAAMRTTQAGFLAVLEGLRAPEPPKDPADWWKA